MANILKVGFDYCIAATDNVFAKSSWMALERPVLTIEKQQRVYLWCHSDGGLAAFFKDSLHEENDFYENFNPAETVHQLVPSSQFIRIWFGWL